MDSNLKKITFSSRLPGFYNLNLAERLEVVSKITGLSKEDQKNFFHFGSLSEKLLDTFVENAIGSFSLPLGIATNFIINGRDILVPMAVEETSVIAAASFGAKLARAGGGFSTRSLAQLMTGQLQLYIPTGLPFDEQLKKYKIDIIKMANTAQPNLEKRGGGAKDLTWYFIPEIQSLVINLHVDTCDAMGANIVTTMCETLSPFILTLFPEAELGLRILTNLSTKKISAAQCQVPFYALENSKYDGYEIAKRIVKAWEFAFYDIYRAATHNKGVMNGIDPVVIATGNDWRAVEAGAHAFCARQGHYRPLTTWTMGSDSLIGSIEMPIALGTIGGVTKLHPSSQCALKILGNPNSLELAQIVCAVGLAQNLSALRALVAEGLQQGHMNLHQKNLSLIQRRKH